jgi:hypothetical protein
MAMANGADASCAVSNSPDLVHIEWLNKRGYLRWDER